jgi:hypothetical protein
MKTIAKLRLILDPFDTQNLKKKCDCVVFTHIVHYSLIDAKVAHDIYMGCNKGKSAVYNAISGKEITHHMWIEIKTQQGKAIADYRLREWLGIEGDTPHGVFLKRDFSHIVYSGKKIEAFYPRQQVMHWLYPDKYEPVPDLAEIEKRIVSTIMSDWLPPTPYIDEK